MSQPPPASSGPHTDQSFCTAQDHPPAPDSAHGLPCGPAACGSSAHDQPATPTGGENPGAAATCGHNHDDHDHDAHGAADPAHDGGLHGHGHGHEHDDDHTHDHHGHNHDGHDHGGHTHDGHDHHHGFGHHHVHTPASFGVAFAIGIVLNTVYLGAEALWGVMSHSLALLADAGHNLSDVLALAAAWLAQHLSAKSPSARFTYGLRRSSILAALANAVILMLVTGGVAWESIQRLFHPAPVAGWTMMSVAAIGILVNGGIALLFASGQKHDINIRGAFLHMASDALTSLAVVIAGGLVLLTGLTWIDPAISLAISVVVVLATWSLLRDSLDMALDGVPRSVDRDSVEDFLRAQPGVADLHDLHIWPMSTTETALTVHLVRAASLPAGQTETLLLQSTVATLRTRFGIVHPTVQIESADYHPPCHLTDPHTV
ncbi:cation diffusion facilitator family transporter [Acetobacter sp. P1H12_c]|uniref:cation diffusion facilitator family transporter n=1 Tax=Acetobacter sp. P1H12_c TaxID=2762621 RepID=UPI001C043182|nr:cation diffusion facilitator family transporter [Acetobacter sp. P1H12_c]